VVLGTYYVDYHGLLTELRGLTKNYPFRYPTTTHTLNIPILTITLSSHCLDEAKSRVYSDPASNRSWNLCWLVLSKIQSEFVTFTPKSRHHTHILLIVNSSPTMLVTRRVSLRCGAAIRLLRTRLRSLRLLLWQSGIMRLGRC
jgi:hypothetical protein